MLLELLFTAAGLLLGSLFLTRYFFTKKNKSSSSLPPLPPAGPSLADFGKEARNCRLPRNQCIWAQQYGNIYTVTSPLTAILPHIVLIGDVAVAKQLLLTEAASCNFTSRTKNVAWAAQQGEGPSITGMVGEEWKWRKRALLREFHRKRMAESERGLLQEIVRTSQRLCQCLSEAAKTEKEPVEVDLITSQVVIDVILYFLFGQRMDFDPQVFRSSAETMLQVAFHCAINPLHFLLRYLPFTKCYEIDRKRDATWKAIDDVIVTEIEQLLLELDDKVGAANSPYPRKPGSALASLLVKEPRFRSGGMDSLIADVRVFILAGFETTAHGLSFAFGLLAMHPEIAQQIAKEGRDVWDKLNSDSSAEIQQALEQAPTAKLFFLETIRLYPLVPTLPGTCLENVTITISHGQMYGLPQGTQVLFTNIILNRQQGGEKLNLGLWEAPPEKQPFVNTFNTGAHVCPGKALSLLEAHVFLLMAATKFEFIIPSDHKGNPMDFMDHVLLKPKEGMPLLIRERVV